jgi:CO/xanthine dehydrogenase FAD-binding subunit
MARVNNISTGAVIDIKGIPECNALEFQNDQLVIGAAITLTQVAQSNLFPLLGKTCKRIADHTIQDKVTLVGNICGTIIYRESILPLLISDAKVVIAGAKGIKTTQINKIFNGRMQLGKGELVVQVKIDGAYINLPYSHVKRTKQDKIDYPLVTVAALKKGKKIRIAFSGVADFPFRSVEIENFLNNTKVPVDARINNAAGALPAPILNDNLGSAEYREFVMRNVMAETMERLTC